MDLSQARAIVVVFSQAGCPACDEYIPRFQAIAAAQPIPWRVIDVGHRDAEDISDNYGIEATPTTMVLKKPTGAAKAEGALDDATIQQLFALAAAQ